MVMYGKGPFSPYFGSVRAAADAMKHCAGNFIKGGRSLLSPRLVAVGFAFGVSILAGAAPAHAEPLRFHGSAGALRAVTGHQSDEFGWGVTGLAGAELPLARLLGLELKLGASWLSEASAPADPTLAPQGDATEYDVGLGMRFYPLAKAYQADKRLKSGGLWVAASGGAVSTGDVTRPLLRAELGVDFAAAEQRVGVGPMIGYAHVFQPNDTLRPGDANLLFAGIHVAFDPWHREPAPPPRYLPPPPPAPVEPMCPGSPGCPDSDRDKDSIVDAKDQCPDVPEDKDGFEDADGCPDLDNDKDGFADAQDHCPDEPETVNGYAEDDGCPDEEQVRVVGDRIVLDDRVHFLTGSAKIRPVSYRLLLNIVQLMNKHPEYVHVAVHGHADERGTPQDNLQLSQDRAESVIKFLAKNGVDAQRLSAQGFGEEQPLVKRSSPSAWFMNRRVEFVITREKPLSNSPSAPKAAGKTNGPTSDAADLDRFEPELATATRTQKPIRLSKLKGLSAGNSTEKKSP